MTKRDEYAEQVIRKGDEGSRLLEEMCQQTCDGARFVSYEGPEGYMVRGLRLPRDHKVVVHAVGGNPSTKSFPDYVQSAMSNLKEQAALIGANLVSIINVLDTHGTDDLSDVLRYREVLGNEALANHISVINGEYAILGAMINPAIVANVNLIGVSIAKPGRNGSLQRFNHHYGYFDHEGMLVTGNGDGVGTKVDVYARAEKFALGIDDLLAMILDDSIKRGAIPRLVASLLEAYQQIPIPNMRATLQRRAAEMGVLGILQTERVGQRIVGWRPGVRAYNLSGAAICTIADDRIAHPLVPEEGDYILAVTSTENPRANGITDRRKVPARLWGESWHLNPDPFVQEYLAYLISPSTVLFPAYRELVDKRVATALYHNSGGAWEKKFGHPIAQRGLYAALHDIPPPNEMDKFVMEQSGTEIRNAYGKWPMGVDGFVTTRDPEEAQRVLQSHGLEGHQIGRLIKDTEDKAGISFTAYDGTMISFS